MARTLYLHIGHGKTGTSYQQSCFALSRNELARNGVHYPAPPKHDRAAAGGVSSGNGTQVAQNLSTPEVASRIATGLKTKDGHVFYSSEFFFHHMTLMKSPDALLAFADIAGCARIEILMLIRDPLDHMRSAYLQNVQRAGVTGSIDEMANRFNMPVRACALMQVFKHPRIGMTVRNYSRMKDHLIEDTEAWLNLPPDTLNRPTQARVNRSLTAAEMEIQRVFNGVFGSCGHLFADAVVDALPELTPDYPAMSAAARQITHDKCANALERINKQIPADQAYEFDLDPAGTPDAAEDEYVTLSEAEVAAIINALAPRIKR